MIFTNCTLILEDHLLPTATLETTGSRISRITAGVATENAVDLHGMYLAPGFVDIHCHGSGTHWFFDAPTEAAGWHLHQGTTSLLCSLWRNAGSYSYERAFSNIRAAMGENSPIRGIHMEGPYLDPELGSEGGTPWPVDPAEYSHLLQSGGDLIRQWTFDPAQPGAEGFAAAVQAAGIPLSVCYSKATPECLEHYLDYGLRIGGHILCGSGCPAPRFAGTQEPGSDQFVLCEDRMYAEVIADSLGGHVRPYYLKFIYKCKGPDRLALVSDCCAGGDTAGSDVNIINGELYGSRLSMSAAVRNMRRYTGVGLVELIRMATATPAKAVGLLCDRGTLAVGKFADLVILNEELQTRGVVLDGNIIWLDVSVHHARGSGH